MKRVNLGPDLEKKKAEIMVQFNSNNGPEPDLNQEIVGTGQGASALSNPDSDMDGYPANADEEAMPVTEDELRERVIEALKTVYDPEIPVNIFDLGLIYKVDIKDSFVDMFNQVSHWFGDYADVFLAESKGMLLKANLLKK